MVNNPKTELTAEAREEIRSFIKELAVDENDAPLPSKAKDEIREYLKVIAADEEKAELPIKTQFAIQNFLLRLIAIPAILASVVSFVVGFFINDVAKKEAYANAYEKVSGEIRSMTAETASAKTAATAARDDSTKASEEAKKSNKEASDAFATAKQLEEQLKTLGETEKFKKEITSQLANDGTFRKAVLELVDPRFVTLRDLSERVKTLEGASVANLQQRMVALEDQIKNDRLLTIEKRVGALETVQYAVFFEESPTDVRGKAGWNLRHLTGISQKQTADISVADNTVTLQPGTYYIEADSDSFANGGNQLVLADVTTAVFDKPDEKNVAIRGMSINCGAGSGSTVEVSSTLKGIITVETPRKFQLWHNLYGILPQNDFAGGALGYHSSTTNRYAQMLIIRIK